jgi:hypothetical protein
MEWVFVPEQIGHPFKSEMMTSNPTNITQLNSNLMTGQYWHWMNTKQPVDHSRLIIRSYYMTKSVWCALRDKISCTNLFLGYNKFLHHYFNTCTMHLLLFCTVTNKCTIISQIITLLHVLTLSCHLQEACNQCLAKLHKYFKCSCW